MSNAIARRYGPIAAVVVLVGAAVLIFGRGAGDDDEEAAGVGEAASGADPVRTDDAAAGRAGG